MNIRASLSTSDFDLQDYDTQDATNVTADSNAVNSNPPAEDATGKAERQAEMQSLRRHLLLLRARCQNPIQEQQAFINII